MWLEWLIEDRAKSIALDSVADGIFAEFVQMPTSDKPWFVGEVIKKMQTGV